MTALSNAQYVPSIAIPVMNAVSASRANQRSIFWKEHALFAERDTGFTKQIIARNAQLLTAKIAQI